MQVKNHGSPPHCLSLIERGRELTTKSASLGNEGVLWKESAGAYGVGRSYAFLYYSCGDYYEEEDNEQEPEAVIEG